MPAPTDRFLQGLERWLSQREEDGLRRHLSQPAGVDLTSNDYLDYRTDLRLKHATIEAVRAVGVGSGASRLLRGHLQCHQSLETALADFCGQPKSLLFSSGFAANIGLIGALAQAGDTIYSDELNHASIIDGIRLARCERVVFPHQDLGTLESMLKRNANTSGQKFIITESLFSMDGDTTDLKALCTLAEQHDALVIVDEAHATGMFGPNGSGLVEAAGLQSRVLCTVHTGGKALGVGGAWIAGPGPVIETLINRCRSFIYSTAPVPALVGALHAAILLRTQDSSTAKAVLQKADALRCALKKQGLDVLQSTAQIVPILIGSSDRAVAIADALAKDGFDVRAVRPPTVAEGTARLRVTVRPCVTQNELNRFCERVTAYMQGETP